MTKTKYFFLQDLHLKVIYRMECRILLIDYHHYWLVDKDHRVT